MNKEQDRNNRALMKNKNGDIFQKYDAALELFDKEDNIAAVKVLHELEISELAEDKDYKLLFYSMLAKSYYYMGNYKESIRYCVEVEKIEEELEEELEGLAVIIFYHGMNLNKLRRNKESNEQLEKILLMKKELNFEELSDDFMFRVYYLMSINLDLLREYDAALELLFEAKEYALNNKDISAVNSFIAKIYYSMGNYSHVVRYGLKALEEFQNFEDKDNLYFILSIAYMKKGDKKQAKSFYNRLAIEFPESEFIDKLEKYTGFSLTIN